MSKMSHCWKSHALAQLLFVFQYYVPISEKIQAKGRAGMDEKSLYPFDESKLGQIFFIS